MSSRLKRLHVDETLAMKGAGKIMNERSGVVGRGGARGRRVGTRRGL